jgi:hypothetical protein
MIFLASLIAIILAAFSSGLAQDVYKWKDTKGQWKFSNTPPPFQEQRDASGPIVQHGTPCVPLKLGEVRQVKSFDRSATHPHLQAVGLQVKLIDISTYDQRPRFAYRLQVNNSSDDDDQVFGGISFLDCSGTPLAALSLGGTQIRAGQRTELSGEVSIGPQTQNIPVAMMKNVGRFSVVLKGADLAQGYQAPYAAYDYSAAYRNQSRGYGHVRILWTRLSGVVGESYVAGDVINAGHGRATNVRAKFTIHNPQGGVATTGTALVNPPDLEPRARGTFRERITLLDLNGHSASSEAEWSP